ncbi:MAG: YtfJ family protein [Gammaproteobacteria bacterium]|nr:YtfJ family protein [Gammaproteobacteria bacterium]MBP6052701.1 YtfJ family protein [Pseudomonadales bacterium]MBK6585056.1 YtfJ family protein [Gammaproteobacteria bacterium]MBK7168704.1 YtfJ family protein [Gammaproteobacteria bacterium]MBK7520229.1 YtfJ family protein [Gammaproteobacteria bacterium]
MAERLVPALALLLALLCGGGANALESGQALPGVRVEELGELKLHDEQLSYAAWDSRALLGKLNVIQYLAARLSSKSLNKPFTDQLEAAGLPLDRYHVTTIVNLDDALFGTRGFVQSELESNKKRYYLSSIVADARGLGLRTWQLAPESSAIIIVDADGRVVFFRDGALSADEIAAALQLLRDGTAELAAR